MSTALQNDAASSSFNYIRELVLQRAAIVLEPHKTYLVETRLAPIIREYGLDSLDQLTQELRTCRWSALHQQVVEAMTTNETSFFRDFHPFEAIKQIVIPELIKRRATSKSLNIWSAACSTGQEPYTIAITLREYFPELHNWSVRIYGSDLSQQVLQRARNGLYNQTEINRGLPAKLLIKYFQKRGLEWQINDDIRRRVEFMEVNLVEPWPAMPRWDIVFLRNVLIYFSCDTKRQILGNVGRRMASDGFLFLGGAETTMNIDNNFCRHQHEQSTYYTLKP